MDIWKKSLMRVSHINLVLLSDDEMIALLKRLWAEIISLIGLIVQLTN